MTRNPGHLPSDAVGKRVHVVLAHGGRGRTDDNPTSPPGWAADGRQGCRWTRTGCRFDIDYYEVIA